MNEQRIAILVGGSSLEAEVSRRSGAAVAKALADTPYKVQVMDVSYDLTAALNNFNPDVVMPIMHGSPGEDGTVQGYLETLGYAYTGSGVEASAAAMNKIIAKQLFRLEGLPLVPDKTFSRHELAANPNALPALKQSLQAELGDDLVIKPACEGSALGVMLIRTENVEAAVVKALQGSERLLIEQRIFGRELTVGVLEDAEGASLHTFPVTEILTPENSWYDFEHRYDPKLSRHIIPADISTQTAERLSQMARTAHQTLGLRDFSRADFLLDQANEIYLLELNSIPGMTATSLYPDAAKVAGFSLTALARQLIANAKLRAKTKEK